MPRILHTADWQVGRQYAQFERDDAAHVAEQRVNAVSLIAAAANEHGADVVLVAGDVFDAQTVSDRLIRQVFAAVAKFKGPWLMISGNHDAALAESVWTRAQRLNVVPENVRLALEPGVIELPNLKVAVLAAPLTQRHTYNDSTSFFDSTETPAGWLRVGLAHGSVEGILSEDIDSANPIASDRCYSARLDYLALGDWHGKKIIHERCAYSGTPEQDRFKSNDPGYCLLVDLDGGAVPTIEPVRIGRYTWHDVVLNIQVESDIEHCCHQLSEFGADDIALVTVRGHTDLLGYRRLSEALASAEAATRSLSHSVEDLRLLPTDDDLAALRADGYVAEVIDELRADQHPDAAPETAALAREALAILCTALDDRRPQGLTNTTTRAAA